MAWPNQVYVGTTGGGVYYTDTFAGPTGGQPTWRALNAGLNELTCREIFLDPFNPSDIQYCLTTGGFYRRMYGSSWTQTLSVTAAYNLLGTHANEDRGHPTLLSFWPDRTIPGKIWANMVPMDITQGDGFALKTLDYGLTWQAYKAFSNGLSYTSYPVVAQGNNIWMGSSLGAGAQADLPYSYTDGASWSNLGIGGYGEWGSTPQYHPSGAGVYTTHGQLAMDLVWFENGILTTLQPGGVGFGTAPIKVSPNDWNHQWLHKRGETASYREVYETFDGWQTYRYLGAIPYDLASLGLFWIEDGNSLFGIGLTTQQKHHVAAYENNDPTQTVRLGGPNAGVPPYTDSIPDGIGSVCYQGIQVVGFTHGSIFTSDVNFSVSASAGTFIRSANFQEN